MAHQAMPWGFLFYFAIQQKISFTAFFHILLKNKRRKHCPSVFRNTSKLRKMNTFLFMQHYEILTFLIMLENALHPRACKAESYQRQEARTVRLSPPGTMSHSLK